MSLPPTSPNENGHRGQFGRMLRLTLKELRETLRDRRTIVTLVLMPLLVYPLLGVAFQKFLLTSLKPDTDEFYRIAVETEEAKKIVEEFLWLGEGELRKRWTRKEQEAKQAAAGTSPNRKKARGRPVQAAPRNREPSLFRIEVTDDMESVVASGAADIGIRISGDLKYESAKRFLNPNNRIWFEMIHQENAPYSKKALAYSERCLDAVNNLVRVRRLEQRRIPAHIVPAHPYRKAIRAAKKPAMKSMSALIPLILILMTITGAVYPAIDLTAGERERGTLEMLVAAPVPRMGLLLAKYVTVLSVAVLTATVNLISMTLTVLATGLGPMLFDEQGLTFGVVSQIFGLLILFAMFFSAVLLAVTSFARSFKEAQAYLIPLMLVSIAPGLFSMMPDLPLDGILTVTPLANIVLLARDVFDPQETAAAVTAAVVILSTLMYAIAAIMIAARIFGMDAVLYGSSGTWSELLRRPEQPADACSPMAAVLALAVAFPLTFLSSQFVGQELLRLPTALLVAFSIITIVVFGGVPLAILASRNVDIPAALSLRGTSLLGFTAAVLLGISLWPFGYELLLGAEEVGIVAFDAKFLEQARETVKRLQMVPPPIIYLTLAVVPAVFEELFFRGMFLSAIRSRATDIQAILASALAFAIFHVIVKEALAIERFLPSFLLGLVLGWVCVRTGSLFPGILLHAANNATLLSLAVFQDQLKEWEFATVDQQHLPWWMLLAAFLVAAAGFRMLTANTKADAVGERSDGGMEGQNPHTI